MADFDVLELEGMRYVRIKVQDETVQAEAGALHYMQGDITVDAPIPSVTNIVRCTLSEEPIIRPRYVGTGEIYLEPSMGGFYAFDVAGESWILENGAYWASEGNVQLGLHRERVITSFWAGEGFIDYQTKVTGSGRVVLNAVGPVEEIALDDGRIAVEGKLVIARTEGLDYRVRRPTRSIWAYWLSGEELVRTYSGTGKVLIVKSPYLSQRLLNAVER
jgi:uncharacterized protein (AIM24 family)